MKRHITISEKTEIDDSLEVIVNKYGKKYERRIPKDQLIALEEELAQAYSKLLSNDFEIGLIYKYDDVCWKYGELLRKALKIGRTKGGYINCIGTGKLFNRITWETLNIHELNNNQTIPFVSRQSHRCNAPKAINHLILEVLIISSRYAENDLSSYPLKKILTKSEALYQSGCNITFKTPKSSGELFSILNGTTADLIHFDSHGEFFDNRKKWGLRFGTNEDNKFYLSISELKNALTPSTAFLEMFGITGGRTIILGACWSDFKHSDLTSGIVDLNGVGYNVVAFKWKLANSVAVNFFERFYQLLFAGKELEYAVQLSSLEFMRNFNSEFVDEGFLNYLNVSLYLNKDYRVFAGKNHRFNDLTDKFYYGREKHVREILNLGENGNFINLVSSLGNHPSGLLKEVYYYLGCSNDYACKHAGDLEQLERLLRELLPLHKQVLLADFPFHMDIVDSDIAALIREFCQHNLLITRSNSLTNQARFNVQPYHVAKLTVSEIEEYIKEKNHDWFKAFKKLKSWEIRAAHDLIEGRILFTDLIMKAVLPKELTKGINDGWTISVLDKLSNGEWDALLDQWFKNRADTLLELHVILKIYRYQTFTFSSNEVLIDLLKLLQYNGFLLLISLDNDQFRIEEVEPYLELYIERELIRVDENLARESVNVVSKSNINLLYEFAKNEPQILLDDSTISSILKSTDFTSIVKNFDVIWKSVICNGSFKILDDYYTKAMPGIFTAIKDGVQQKDFNEYYTNFTNYCLMNMLNFQDTRSWIIRRMFHTNQYFAAKWDLNWISKASGYFQFKQTESTVVPLEMENYRLNFHLTGRMKFSETEYENSETIGVFIGDLIRSDYQSANSKFAKAFRALKQNFDNIQLQINYILIGALLEAQLGSNARGVNRMDMLLDRIPINLQTRFIKARILTVRCFLKQGDLATDQLLDHMLYCYRNTQEEHRYNPDILIQSWLGCIKLIEDKKMRFRIVMKAFFIHAFSSFNPAYRVVGTMYCISAFVKRGRYDLAVLFILFGSGLSLGQKSHKRRRRMLNLALQLSRRTLIRILYRGQQSKMFDERTQEIIKIFLIKNDLPVTLQELMIKNILIAPGLMQKSPSK